MDIIVSDSIEQIRENKRQRWVKHSVECANRRIDNHEEPWRPFLRALQRSLCEHGALVLSHADGVLDTDGSYHWRVSVLWHEAGRSGTRDFFVVVPPRMAPSSPMTGARVAHHVLADALGLGYFRLVAPCAPEAVDKVWG